MHITMQTKTGQRRDISTSSKKAIVEKKHSTEGNCEKIRKYWVRRSKLLARAKESLQILTLERNIQVNSRVPQLDVKLEIKKAQLRLKRGQHLLSVLHTNLSVKANDCLQQLPSDRSPTEDELSNAFNGQRLHTTHSEPYFWEQSYSVYALTQPIAIDLEGRAHIFKEVQPSRKSSDNTEPSGVRKWECDTRLCRLPAESVEGVTALLNSLKATKQRYYKHFYLHLDDCNNSTRDNRLGHSLYRSRENDCHSLLRPALTLAPHFPHLRLIVCRLYELRRLVQSMQFVESAMQSGDFDRLKRSMKELDSTMLQLRPQSTQSPTKALVTK